MTLAIPVLALALDYLLCEFLNPLARISLMVLSGLGLIGWIILAVRSTSAGASYFRLPGIDSELKWYDWGLSIIVSGLIVLNLFL
jgi:hypothetical protein